MTADGEPVCRTMPTRHLEIAPRFSPEYFAARYPQHAEQSATYYVRFTLVACSERQGGAFHVMIESVVQIFAAERSAVGWDICSYNDNSRFSFADALSVAVGEQVNVEIAVEDSQTYYAARFIGDGPDKGA